MTMDETTFKIKPHVLVYGKFKDPNSDSILLAYEHQITSLSEKFPKGLSKVCLQIINEAEINKNERSGIILRHYLFINKIYIIFAKISLRYEVGNSGRRYTQATVWVFEEDNWNIAYLSGCIDAITTKPDIKEAEKLQLVYSRQIIKIKKGDKIDITKYSSVLNNIEHALQSGKNLTPNTEKIPKTLFISLLVQSLQTLEKQVGAYAKFLSLAINIESKNYQISITETQEKRIEYISELFHLTEQLPDKKVLEAKPKIYKLALEKPYLYNHFAIIIKGGIQRTIDTIITQEIQQFINLDNNEFPRIRELQTKKEKENIIRYILETIKIDNTDEQIKLRSSALLRYTKGDVSWDQAWVNLYQKYDELKNDIHTIFILRHQAIQEEILIKNNISQRNFPTRLNNFKHLLKLCSLPFDFKEQRIKISDNHDLTHAFIGDLDNPYLFFKKVLKLFTSKRLWHDFTDLDILLKSNRENPIKWLDFTLLKYAISWKKGQFIYHLHLFLLIGEYISKPQHTEKIRHLTPELSAKVDFYAAISSAEKLLEKIKKLSIKQPALKIKHQTILKQIKYLDNTMDSALAIVDAGLKQDLFNQPLSIVEKGFLYLVIDKCIEEKQKRKIFPLFEKYPLEPHDINGRTADEIIQKI